MSAQLTLDRTEVSLDTTQAPAVVIRRGRIRGAWHRIRLAISDMNYGARRIVEVQAPWSVDAQWHNR
jgi:hypothetical protein